jgi:hypothetical protein
MAGYEKLLQKRHENSIWTRYAIMALGLWLVTGLESFTYDSEKIFVSDFLSGIGLVVFGALSIKEERRWAPWVCCFIGIWLLASPILFWAPEAVCYLNDTLSGILVVVLSVIIPGSPGIIESGPEVPHDWSYNPSSWLQRLPLVSLSFFSFLIARFLLAFQLGYIPSIWEPFFDEATAKMLSSYVAVLLPFPESGLASFVFAMQLLLGSKGSSRRWHTMPWAVLLFGIFVVFFGLVATFGILVQPLFFGTWSSLMLLLALLMMGTVILSVDEVVATLQFIVRARRDGTPYWQAFWVGSQAVVGGHVDARSPSHAEVYYHLFPAMCWGLTFPLTLLLSVFVGAWLLVSGNNFSNMEGLGSYAIWTANHVLGALIIITSLLSCAEVLRFLRHINFALGLMVCIIPWYYEQSVNAESWENFIIGLAVVFLSFPKGQIKQRYGSLERFIR